MIIESLNLFDKIDELRLMNIAVINRNFIKIEFLQKR